jgi:tRNA/rRNA methyltransferase
VDTVNLQNIGIVLVEPQIPENVGSVARAMNNMGISRLLLVKPVDCDLTRILKMATGPSIDIIEEMEVYDDLMNALGPFQHVVGTTARIGAQRPALTTPHKLARDLIPISQNNLVAILFGPEDRGLSNEHLRYCHTIATIPTSRFSSLNLAQAVMIVCYEIFLTSKEPREETLPRLANKFELEGMYEHLKNVLMKIGFIDPQNPEHWMLNIRRFLSRIPLRAREVRVIRGICRQIDWYTDQLEKIQKKNLYAKGGSIMSKEGLLDGKKILAVDDEPDILDTLEHLLPMCDVVKATTADEAIKLLETEYFDIAILDIMGVDGYKLLEISKKRKVIPVMLTAHALSVENTVKSFKKGAASYLPKDEMAKIETFLNDILEAKEKGENFWWRWLDRLGLFYEKKFGPDWQSKDEDFWRRFPSW